MATPSVGVETMITSDLEARLAELPDAWRGDVPLALLRACRVPSEAQVASPIPGTHYERVQLPCRPARSSLPGPHAFIPECDVEFFLFLGCTPLPLLKSAVYLAPPDGAAEAPMDLLVPVPDDDPLFEVAYDHAARGEAWKGEAFGWPASYDPPHVERRWAEGRTVMWDGVDASGRPTGGITETPSGWEDRSSLARLRAGCAGVWTVTIEWQPRPVVTEYLGGSRTHRPVPSSPWPFWGQPRRR